MYLIYLGIKAWFSKPISHTKNAEKLIISTPSRLKVFSEPYVVGISNPKAIAFCSALFPQIINLDQPVFLQFALLAGTFAICSFLFLVTYVVLASKLRKHLEKKKTLAWFNRITGGVFIGFSAALVSSSHA